MKSEVHQLLITLADENYRRFSTSLLPGVENLIGVRLPALRSIAKDLARADWHSYLQGAQDDTFEEIMLQGMVIGMVHTDFQTLAVLIEEFVPKIDNWSVCDSFCAGLKQTKLFPTQMWIFLQPYLYADRPYHLRFGIVMLLNYYINDAHIDRVFLLLDDIRHENYYVKMAVAWTVSACYRKFPDKTLIYLNQNKLDDFTYHKALQKICELRGTDANARLMLKKMRRKL